VAGPALQRHAYPFGKRAHNPIRVGPARASIKLARRIQTLKGFVRSLAERGMHGAAMLVPPPGGSSAEYGIIRSFASAADRDAFYSSPLYLEWKKRVAPLSDGSLRPRTPRSRGIFSPGQRVTSAALENGHCHLLVLCRSS